MKSSNPALRSDIFSKVSSVSGSQAMTIQGAVNKTFILLACVFVTASWVWANPVKFMPAFIPALIAAFIVAMVTIFKKEWAQYTSVVYALLEGVILGVISSYMEKSYPGIVVQAVGLTFGVLFSLLLAFTTGIIKVTEKFRMGVFGATAAIALFYLVSIVLRLFGVAIPFIHDSGPLGIGFSVIVVIIASLNLVLDFDFFQQGARAQAPKYMEWYAAFGLMVTLIWLYIEILRLLSKLRRR